MSQIDRSELPGRRRRALYIGNDWVQFQKIEDSIKPAFEIVMEQDIPHIWPEDIELVLLEAGRDMVTTLDTITRITAHSKGVAPFLLIRDRNVELLLQSSRLGVRSFIEVPDDLPDILTIVQKVSRHSLGQGGVISTFFSLKGGVGCTTLSVNVSHHLSKITEGRTVLVDLNVPLGDTALYMGLEEDGHYSIADFIYNMGRFDEKLVYESLIRHDNDVYLLGLPKRLEELENLTPEAIQATLDTLRRYFDHVVVDCASDLSAATLSCFDESDYIVLVTEPSLASLRASRTVYELSQELGYPTEKLRLILNRHTAVGEEMIEELIEAMALPVAARVANDYMTFLECIKAGELLHDYTPGCLPDRQILSIAEMLHQGTQSVSEQSAKRSLSVFQRMINKVRVG